MALTEQEKQDIRQKLQSGYYQKNRQVQDDTFMQELAVIAGREKPKQKKKGFFAQAAETAGKMLGTGIPMVSAITKGLSAKQAYTSDKGIGETAKTLFTPAPPTEMEKDIASTAGEAIVRRGKEIGQTTKDFATGDISLGEAQVRVTGDILNAAFETLGAPLSVGLKPVVEKIAETEWGAKAFTELAQTKEGYEKWKSTSEFNKRVGEFIEGLASIATAGVVKIGAKPVLKAVERGAELTADTVKPVFQEVKRTAEQIATKIPFTEARGVTKIEEIIAPKLLKREVQKALSEGRVIRGKKSIIFGKKPDIVQLDNLSKRAAQTISELIPGADRLTDAQLVVQLDNKIARLSQELSPGLKQVFVDDITKNDMLNSWLQIKENQATSVGRKLSGPRFKGAQDDFEKMLLEAIDTDDLDQLWALRKKYDDTTPENVKNAGEKSAEGFQFEREIWLENRRIMNEVIEKLSEGLENEARRFFEQLRDMYTARTNIINRADISRKKIGGIFLPRRLIEYGLGATGLGIIGKGFID